MRKSILPEHHINLAHYIVARYIPISIKDRLGLDEVISLAYLALVKASKYFDERVGVQFSTYAGNCIKRDIYSYYNRVIKQESILSNHCKSLHRTVRTIKDYDILLSETIGEVDPNLEGIETKLTFEKMCDFAKNLLTDQEYEIFNYRFKEGLTCAKIAERLEITKQRVSFIEHRAIKKIRECLKTKREYIA